MKKIFPLLFLLAIVFQSCDNIENPIPETSAINWDLYPFDTIANPYPWPVWTSNTNTIKRILLEDFTGHTCTNCPAAATIAKQLEDDNVGKVIVASIHASPSGTFQAVQLPEFVTDFQTTAGNIYVNEMESFLGNPMGTVNRTSNGFAGSVWFFDSDWSSAVTNELTGSLIANIQLEYNYYPQTNGLFIHTESEFNSSLSGDYNLIIYLIRDAVEAPQKLNNGTTEEEYEHHAVLTDNINGTWGDAIVNGNVNAGDKFYNDYSYQLTDPANDSTFDINNLSLITYLCDRNTYEVIQVIKTELTP